MLFEKKNLENTNSNKINFRKNLGKVAGTLIELLTEVLRWTTIILFLIFIFGLIKNIIDPILINPLYGETLRTILDFSFISCAYKGIKKIKSVLNLLFIALACLICIRIEPIIEFLKEKYETITGQ